MNVRCSICIPGVSAGLLLALAVFPASAHHSAAVFDMSKQISVHGTVRKWLWANPHSWLYLDAAKAGAPQDIWGFEAGSTGALARSGWNAADLNPGDQVTVFASPERDGGNIGLLSQVRLASGRVLGSAAGPPPGSSPGAPPGAPPGGATTPPPAR